MMREQNETRHKRTGIVGHASCVGDAFSCSKWAQLGGVTKLQKKAPNVLKSLDAKLKSAPPSPLAGEGTIAQR